MQVEFILWFALFLQSKLNHCYFWNKRNFIHILMIRFSSGLKSAAAETLLEIIQNERRFLIVF